MSRRAERLLASCMMIITVVTAACGAGRANTSDSGAGTTPVSDILHIGALDDGLDKLKSYRARMQYSLDGKSDANKAQSISIDLTREVVAASRDQHITVSTATTGYVHLLEGRAHAHHLLRLRRRGIERHAD